MKINISILAILFYSFLPPYSSDKLTKEQAEIIIKNCQTAQSNHAEENVNAAAYSAANNLP